MILRCLLLPALLCLVGCGEPAPPLAIGDVDVFAPLPGSSASVAYMTMTNNTGDPIVVEHVSSPQFGRVELHETQISDGIASMRAIGTLPIPAGSSVELEEGGMHLMLMQPEGKLAVDQPVTLRVHYDTDGVVMVTTVLKSRLAATR